MLSNVMSVAAFGFVAFVLVFVPPASQAGRAAAQQEVRAATLPLPIQPLLARSHFAASK
jgi:hypothetical protein